MMSYNLESAIKRAAYSGDRNDLLQAAPFVEGCSDIPALLRLAQRYETELPIIELLTRRILELDRSNQAALELLGQALILHHDERIHFVIRELKLLNPDNIRMLDLQMLTLSPHSDALAVETITRRMLELDPANERAVSALAKALHSQGRRDEASKVIGGFLKSNVGLSDHSRNRLEDLQNLFQTSTRLPQDITWP